jgi:hypothetical protein
MAFSDTEKTDLRRFCGYPAYGAGAAGFQSWRYFQVYGLLEYRLGNMAAAEEAVMRNTYLVNLYTLEAAIISAAANMDTDEAGPWKHNGYEIAERTSLFNQWRRYLCEFLGLPAGPYLGNASSRPVVM